MNDFLKQLRSGANKRFDKNRRPFENGPYRNTDRQNGRDRKNPQYRKNFDNTGQLQAVKKILDTLVEGQKTLIEQVKRQSSATERIAYILERIGEHQYGQQGLGAPPDAADGTTDAPRELAPADEGKIDAPAPTDRESLLKMIVEKRSAGESFEEISRYLDENEIPTLSGKGQWRAQSVSRFYNQHEQQDA